MASLRFTPAVPRETPPSSHLRWPPFHRWWQIQGKDAALSASRLLCAGASLFYRCGGYWGEINHFLRGLYPEEPECYIEDKIVHFHV
ncbi:hypothetical protein U9M48_024334 [Paspalum notatum var. saurae]|uniref:Uncharacterized protein n=1 Tax=Paspalum notatum var. saurae TaxID=547442 RepID=A0AAQ3TSQ9_PASNO